MRYQGGKVKASRYYAPMFNEFIRQHGFKNYVEPFCGSLAVAEKIECKNIICNDANEYLITLYRGCKRAGYRRFLFQKVIIKKCAKIQKSMILKL